MLLALQTTIGEELNDPSSVMTSLFWDHTDWRPRKMKNWTTHHPPWPPFAETTQTAAVGALPLQHTWQGDCGWPQVKDSAVKERKDWSTTFQEAKATTRAGQGSQWLPQRPRYSRSDPFEAGDHLQASCMQVTIVWTVASIPGSELASRNSACQTGSMTTAAGMVITQQPLELVLDNGDWWRGCFSAEWMTWSTLQPSFKGSGVSIWVTNTKANLSNGPIHRWMKQLSILLF